MGLRTNDACLKMSFLAAADLSSYQYHFVKESAADTVNICGAGDSPVGILQNKPDAAGKGASVVILGASMLVAGGTITRQAYLKADASAHAVVTSTDTNEYGAKALAAAVTGDIFPAVFTPGNFAG